MLRSRPGQRWPALRKRTSPEDSSSFCFLHEIRNLKVRRPKRSLLAGILILNLRPVDNVHPTASGCNGLGSLPLGGSNLLLFRAAASTLGLLSQSSQVLVSPLIGMWLRNSFIVLTIRVDDREQRNRQQNAPNVQKHTPEKGRDYRRPDRDKS